MRAVRPVRSDVLVGAVDLRARLILDPVARLRFLRRAMTLDQPEPRRRLRLVCYCAAALGAFLLAAPRAVAPAPAPRFQTTIRPPKREPLSRAVWLVEQTADWELYSNGLRVEKRFSVSGPRRRYQAFLRAALSAGAAVRGGWRTEPGGIVFHTSESDLAAFDADHNLALKRQGEGLLDYVRRRRLYHFVIDRFGRVHRIVEEGGKADHAGNSVWADADWVYVNLNGGFLGVCFEGQTRPGMNAAQLHAGRILIEVLRSKYRIPAANCVTHAQVSVNPRNFRIGYHTDWASGFPFAELGLTDGYAQPPAGLAVFGFEYDRSFMAAAGDRLRGVLETADEQLQEAAVARGLSPARYRADLRQKYMTARAAIHQQEMTVHDR